MGIIKIDVGKVSLDVINDKIYVTSGSKTVMLFFNDLVNILILAITID